MKNLLSLFLLTFTMIFSSIGMSQTFDYEIASYGDDASNSFDPDWTFTGMSGSESSYNYVFSIGASTYSLDGTLNLPSMGSYTDVQFVVDFESMANGDVITVSTSPDGSSWTVIDTWTDDGGDFYETTEFVNSGDTFIKLEVDGTFDPSYGMNFILENFKVNVDTTVAASPPTADFTASSTTISTGSSIDFTNTSTTTGTVTYDWDFTGSDTPTSSDENPSTITYSTAGTYTVELTVTDDGGSDTETKTSYITVVDGPVADFTASSTTVVEGNSIDFTDLSSYGTGVSWSWTFTGADVTSSSDENPTGIVYSTPGTYTVELTITDDMGTDTETKTSYITVTDSTVGVDENVSNFNVYSYNSNIVVKSTDFSNYTINVYNLNGQVVFNETTSGDNEFTLDVQSGIYVVYLTSEDGSTTTQKLSLQ
ncbi:MAG: Protease 1 [uncultured marine phage]|uniref:Protease 1 n=1 Tax=uncultured marine phage TaxID=707152 RepID=A0A8D9FQY2_9VIRU|nr:MAG: Protease 1 [uncultured marine phage]